MMMRGASRYLRDGIQQFMGEGYEGACYALCLLDVARQYNETYQPQMDFDVLDVLTQAASGTDPDSIIYYNRSDLQDNDNFYVQHPDKLLELCTGKTWEVRKEAAGYRLQAKEYKINRWERVRTGTTTGHFERDSFHPIIGSYTVQYGALKSLRICKVIYG